MILKRLLPILFLFCTSIAQAQFSGNALDLDGSNDMVVINTVPALFSSPATNDFTIEAWVNPRGSLFARILFAQPSTTNFVSLGTSTGNVIYFYVISGGTTYSIATSAGIVQNQWTHVAARWTAATSTPQVFFNGVLQAGVAGGSSSTGTNGLVVLGSRPGGAQYFNGALDEMRVWNEARTQCEIQNNMNNSITGAQTNLVMNYDFNQGVAGGANTGITALPDLSGGAFNGTLTNVALTGATSNWITSLATLTTSGNPLGGIVASQSAAICSGLDYTFPDGSTTTNITSTLSHLSTLIAFSGCDSLLTTTVNVNSVYSSSATVAVCSGSDYTFPDGSTTTNITSTASHVSTLTTFTGCDSVITTTVNVNPTYSNSATATVCSGMDYTFPDGSTTTNITSTTSHVSTLTTITGCDSVITTTVNVNPTYSNSATAAVCSGADYTFPDGSTSSNITSTTSHMSMLTTFSGCDSVITTTVSVNPTYAINETDSVCFGGNYTFPDGSTTTTITSSMMHTSTFATLAGCDSIITSTISIIAVNASVTQSGSMLTADEAAATYQWLDCGNAYAVISGEIGQNFTPLTGGSYAVEVTMNGCSDTSTCFSSSVGVNELSASQIAVYPNPATDAVTIRFNKTMVGTIELIGISGAIVSEMQFNGTSCTIDLSGIAQGFYRISIHTVEGNVMKQVVKTGN